MTVAEVVFPHNPRNGWDKEPRPSEQSKALRLKLNTLLDRDNRLIQQLRTVLSRKTCGSEERVLQCARSVIRLYAKFDANTKEIVRIDQTLDTLA